jgi:hypothetical protein
MRSGCGFADITITRFKFAASDAISAESPCESPDLQPELWTTDDHKNE